MEQRDFYKYGTMRLLLLGWTAMVLANLLLPEFSWALVGGGGYVPFAGKMQTDKEGGDNAFDPNPFLTIHTFLPLGKTLSFKPQGGWVRHGGTGDDYHKNTFFFLYHLSLQPYDLFLVNFGLGNFITSVGGKGETTVLNNGNSTATFYRPSESQISFNTTLDFGLEFYVQKNYTLAGDLFLFNFLSSQKRKISYSFSLNYYL